MWEYALKLVKGPYLIFGYGKTASSYFLNVSSNFITHTFHNGILDILCSFGIFGVKSTPDPENIEIFNNRQDEKILIKNRLLKLFSNSITINVSNYEFSVLFKTKSSFKRFVCMCREYQESLDPNDVLIIDVDDMLDFKDIYKRNTILYLMPSTIGILPRVLDYYELKTR